MKTMSRLYWVGIVLLCIISMCNADQNRTAFELGFISDYYPSVSFDDLIKYPDKYTGTKIRVTGFLAEDYDILDVAFPALYRRRVSRNGPKRGAQKIKLDICYSDALDGFGYPQACTVFGVWVKHQNSEIAGKWLRIDRIEGQDGKTLNVKFVVESKKQ